MKQNFQIYRLCRDQATIDRLKKEEIKYSLPSSTYSLEIDLFEFVNYVIHNCEKKYALLCHDDVYLPENIQENIHDCIIQANTFFGRDKWGVMGNAGVNIITKRPFTFISDPHTLMLPFKTKKPFFAESLDGNTLLLNINALRGKFVELPTSLSGYHFYDLILCMECYKNGLICGISSYLYVKHLSPGNYESFLLSSKEEQFRKYFKENFRNHTITTINGPISIERGYINLSGKEKDEKQSYEEISTTRCLEISSDKEFDLHILTRIHLKSYKLYRLFDSIRVFNNLLPSKIKLHVHLGINNIDKETMGDFIKILKQEYKDLDITERWVGNIKERYPRFEALKQLINDLEEKGNSFTWIIDYDDFIIPQSAKYMQHLFSESDIIVGNSAIFEEEWGNKEKFPIISTYKTTLEYTNTYSIYSGINKTPVCSVIYNTTLLKNIVKNYELIGDYYEDYTLLLLASTKADIQGYPLLFAGISAHGKNTIAETDRTHWDYSYSTYLSYLVNQGLIKKNYYDFFMASNDELMKLRSVSSEFESFKQGLIWKNLTKYRRIKSLSHSLLHRTIPVAKFHKYLKNFFINIYRDGPVITFKRIFNRILTYFTSKNEPKDPYELWLKRTNRKNKHFLVKIKKNDPKIGIFLNLSSDNESLIKRTVKSILNQSYRNWHLYIVNNPKIKKQTLQTITILSKRKRISLVNSDNYVATVNYKTINGDESFITFIRSGDILQANSLAESVTVINEDKRTALIYSDSDLINNDGKRTEPFFKPDWSPDMFLSVNYLSPFVLIRKSLLKKIGGLRLNFWEPTNYDLLLRATEETDKIKHISKVLYSQSKINNDFNKTKQQISLENTLKRREIHASVSNGLIANSFRVKYTIIGEPLVSIIIPTKDKPKIFRTCISSILQKTNYKNYEILIIDTGSTEKETLNFYKKIEKNKKIRFLKWDKAFNYSAVNNYAVRYSKGDYLLFLNNDTEVISEDWIQGLLEHAQRKNVGAVGARLYYPNNTLQHAGIVVGLFDSAGHIMNGLPREIHNLPYTKDLTRNWSALTAACLMIKKVTYNKMGGFDEKFPIALNDVDLGLKLLEYGYYNVYTPYVELYHHESISVGKPMEKNRDNRNRRKEIYRFRKRWERYVSADPYFNPNYSKYESDLRIDL